MDDWPEECYDFATQLAAGQDIERRLDLLFKRWFKVEHAAPAEQRSGIDRFLLRGRARHAIEYKADFCAHRTGNVFLETISVDASNKPGWLYSSAAEYIAYCIVADELVFVFRFNDLRRLAKRWDGRYPKKSAPNAGYRTFGLLVPLDEFERHATFLFSLNTPPRAAEVTHAGT